MLSQHLVIQPLRDRYGEIISVPCVKLSPTHGLNVILPMSEMSIEEVSMPLRTSLMKAPVSLPPLSAMVTQM